MSIRKNQLLQIIRIILLYGVWKALGDQLRRRPDGLYNNTDITEKLFGLDRQNYATPQVTF